MDEPHDGLSKWAKAHGRPSLRRGELRKELAVSGTWAMTGAIFLFNKHVLGIFSISCIGTWALGLRDAQPAASGALKAHCLSGSPSNYMPAEVPHSP